MACQLYLNKAVILEGKALKTMPDAQEVFYTY